MVMIPLELGTENHCAGEGQQQYSSQSVTHCIGVHREVIKTRICLRAVLPYSQDIYWQIMGVYWQTYWQSNICWHIVCFYLEAKTMHERTSRYVFRKWVLLETIDFQEFECLCSVGIQCMPVCLVYFLYSEKGITGNKLMNKNYK
jgi:hypothetical protein